MKGFDNDVVVPECDLYRCLWVSFSVSIGGSLRYYLRHHWQSHRNGQEP